MGLCWAEADFIEDVERIEQWFKTGSAPRLPIQSALTGAERYWNGKTYERMLEGQTV
jgi:hypothetical protein